MDALMSNLKAVFAWDRSVRIFHWVNLACMIGLIAVGLAILNASALGVPNDGKILLKSIHVLIGYVFAVNLAFRLLWAFIGGPRARWRAILPGGRGYLGEVRSYVASVRARNPHQYLGHNPLGRLSVTILLFLLLSQAVSGLVLAGTDLFFPPLGAWIAAWVAAPGTDSVTLVPYAPTMYDTAAFDAMRAFRKPFAAVHVYGFYVLLVFGALHILAVVITEIREGGGLVSAMITGRKTLDGPPVDQP
jgi:cytochrome b